MYLIFAVAQYQSLGMALSVFGIQLEEGIKCFPK